MSNGPERWHVTRGPWLAHTRYQIEDPALRLDEVLVRAELFLARSPERGAKLPLDGQYAIEIYAPWDRRIAIQVRYEVHHDTRSVIIAGVYRLRDFIPDGE